VGDLKWHLAIKAFLKSNTASESDGNYVCIVVPGKTPYFLDWWSYSNPLEIAAHVLVQYI
jgi:hypothetical protein